MIACYLVPTVQLGLICCVRLNFSNIFLRRRLSPEESGCRCTCTEAPRHCLFELPVERARVFKREKPERGGCWSFLPFRTANLERQGPWASLRLKVSVPSVVSPGPRVILLVNSDSALGYKKAPFSKLALNSLLWVFLIIFAWLLCAFVIIWEWGSSFKFYFIPFKCDKYKYGNKAAYVNNRDVWNCGIFAFLQKPQEVANISADGNYFFHLKIITQHKICGYLCIFG